MQINVDYNDYVSILAYVRHLSRWLEPVLQDDLPALLGRRTPSGLARVADAAGRCRLHARGNARDMLPVIVDACTMAIQDGARVEGDWVEVGYSDGGVDWAWREAEVLSAVALEIVPIRREVQTIISLIERVEDLVAAQREIGELAN